MSGGLIILSFDFFCVLIPSRDVIKGAYTSTNLMSVGISLFKQYRLNMVDFIKGNTKGTEYRIAYFVYFQFKFMIKSSQKIYIRKNEDLRVYSLEYLRKNNIVISLYFFNKKKASCFC